MDKKPIIIVGGEPNSIFLEIFFKSIKSHNYRSPLILVASKKLLHEQMKKLGFNFEINTNKSNKASSFGQGLLANIKILKAFIKSI